MQHVKAGDYMTGSAKRSVDTALADAKSRRVGGAPAPVVQSGEVDAYPTLVVPPAKGQ